MYRECLPFLLCPRTENGRCGHGDLHWFLPRKKYEEGNTWPWSPPPLPLPQRGRECVKILVTTPSLSQNMEGIHIIMTSTIPPQFLFKACMCVWAWSPPLLSHKWKRGCVVMTTTIDSFSSEEPGERRYMAVITITPSIYWTEGEYIKISINQYLNISFYQDVNISIYQCIAVSIY